MFGFPPINRKQDQSFKKNFLKNVIFQVSFEQCPKVTDSHEQFVNLLSSKYPVINRKQEIKTTFKVGEYESNKQSIEFEGRTEGIVFSNKENTIGLYIIEDTLFYIISGSYYTNYDSFIKSTQQEIESIFKICNVTHFNSLAIRKVNLFQFKIINDNFSPIEATKEILNEELVSSFFAIPSHTDTVKCISNISLTKEAHRLNLSYGLMRPQESIQNLLIDIDVIYKKENIPLNTIFEKLQEINDEIYNIFNWTLHESAIDKFLNN